MIESFSHFDFILFAVIGVSAFVGFFTGLMRELATLFASLGALGCAFLTYRVFGERFSEQLVSESSAFDFALIIYLSVAIAAYVGFATLLSMLMRGLTDQRSVSLVDKLFGFALGTLRGLAIGVLFVFFLDVFIDRDRVPPFISNAQSYPLLKQGSNVLLRTYLPENKNTLDNNAENS